MDGASNIFKQGTQLVMKFELGDCSNRREDAKSNFSCLQSANKRGRILRLACTEHRFQDGAPNLKKVVQQNTNARVNDFSAHVGGEILTGFSNSYSYGNLLNIASKITSEICLECTFCGLLFCGLACRSSKQFCFVGTFAHKTPHS